MRKIILTGGGTAGHCIPNLALVPALKESDFEIKYIGSYDGIEKKLVEEAGIPYFGISSGKLRRYFDLKNFSDPFRVLKGFGEALSILK
ncbi:MAG: glycosyltransferase, partial [Lachnospiraceae bacterium]|nr:glycosyltransferase [Lachnospiraceae bacterium]